VLLPMVESTSGMRTDQTLVTADAGYHSEANLKGLYELGVPALIADGLMRRRDERFADQAKYKVLPDPLYDKAAHGKALPAKFKPSDFAYDTKSNTCICPAGKKLYSTGSHCTTHGREHHKFQGAKRDCLPCHLREQCLRHPERTPTRQVAFFEKNQNSPLQYTERMKAAIDTDRGRALYGQRIATVEPVFGNLRHNKGLDRFTLRTRPKVNAQWNLYCLVHNIEKLAHHGYRR
jgi:DDE family transposase